MTNRQALEAELFGIDVPANLVLKALADNELAETQDYDSIESFEAIKICAKQICEAILSTPDVSEGDMSIKYDRSAIQARLILIDASLESKAPIPEIRGRSNVW
jgi:hypothetical protein